MLIASLGLQSAWAQSPPPALDAGFDAHGFHLAAHDGDLRDPLSLQRPGAFDQGDWFLSGLAEYARAPLVYELSSDLGDTVQPVVDNLLALNLALGVAAHERIRFDLLAPVYGLSTTGADPVVQPPAMGDLRGTVMLVAVRPNDLTDSGGFGLGFHGHVDAPTGTPARTLGLGTIGGGGGATMTYEWSPATLTADAGVQFAPEVDLGTGTGNDALTGGLALGWRASETVGLTLEANTAVPFVASPDGYRTLPPIESIASLRYVSPSGAFWTLGVAGGLTDGPGVATFRAFLGGGFAKRDIGGPDVDTIGVLRATDLCPLEPETHNGWKDDDGCPDRLGTLGIDVKFRGESRAADAEITGPDGAQSLRIGPQGLVLDAVPGSTWTVKATDGCLTGEATATAADSGARLVVDMQPRYDAKVRVEVVGPTDNPLAGALVAWRSDKSECVPMGTSMADSTGQLLQDVSSGSHRLVVTASGHNVVEQPAQIHPGDNPTIRIKLAASKIVVEQKQIRILEKVQFQYGKATILPDSYGLLNEVANVINSAPHIGRVEVAGHTDNKGPPDYNLKLSRDRAYAVRDYLIAQGVPPERLVAVGHGESKPIDTNKTEQGRQVNRRVEFNLIDSPEGGG